MADIRVLETRTKRVNGSVVETLERALEGARRGEFSGVAIAFVRTDGLGAHRWSEGASAGALIGSITVMQHDLAAQITGGTTPGDPDT